MILVAIFNSIVVLLSTQAKFKDSNNYLKLSFFLIFCFLAFRYDYGNDYHEYFNYFYSIQYFDIFSKWEPGWQILCLLFKPFGFFSMVAFLAAFQCFVYYRLIKKHVPYQYYWYVVFLFLFKPDNMLVLSSAMRQSLAVCIFFYSIDYLYKKDAIRYCICVYIASLFHASALILLPIFVVGVFNFKINNNVAIILLIIYPLSFLFIYLFADYFLQFTSLYFEKYSPYLYNGGTNFSSGYGFILFFYLYAVIIYNSRLQDGVNLIFFKLAILTYLISPIFLLSSISGRLLFYLQIFLSITISIILFNAKTMYFKLFLLIVYIYFALTEFLSFFDNPTWVDYFKEYKTIFSAKQLY